MKRNRLFFVLATLALAAACGKQDPDAGRTLGRELGAKIKAEQVGGTPDAGGAVEALVATQTITATVTDTETSTQTIVTTVTSTGTQVVPVTQTTTSTVTTTAVGTITRTETSTATATATGTRTGTVTQTATQTRTATATVTATATRTTTSTSTGTQTATASKTATATQTQTQGQVLSYNQVYVLSGTVTSTNTATVYYTQWAHSKGTTATATTTQFIQTTGAKTVTATVTSTFNGTETKTATASMIGSGTTTGTVTVTVTATQTSSSTNGGGGGRTVTSTGTATGTATQSWTYHQTATVTTTVTTTSTNTVTGTRTVTSTVTSTTTPTLTNTGTVTVTSTATVTSPTTVTSTVTNSGTTTDTSTVTTTGTVTNTNTVNQTQTVTNTSTTPGTATQTVTTTHTMTSTATATGGATLAITQQPVSQTVAAAPNTGVTFTLAAVGTGTITYHWYALNGETPVSLGSGPDPNLYVSAEPYANLPQTFTYFCVVTDGSGGARQSNLVTLTLLPPVFTITQQPVSQTVAAAPGTGVTFTLAATGSGTITYHWYAQNGETPISLGSGPDPNLYVSAEPYANLPQVFSYYCVVTDGYGYTRQSDTVTLTLLPPGPMITQQPVSQTVAAAAGTGVTFTLAATGTGTITYHWYAVNGETPISLGSGPDPNLYVSAQPYENLPQTFSYYCVVSDGNGNLRQSNTVTLTLLPPGPMITQQPVSQTVAAAPNTGVTFTLVATGTGALTYHWYAVNGETPISLGSGPDPNLYVSAQPYANLPQTFSYYCVVSDGGGNTRQSNTVTLTLLPPALTITQQPVSRTVAAAPGTGVTFTLLAVGTGTITYHWYAVNGETPISLGSGPDPNLYVSAEPYANLPQTFSYYCVVSDGYGYTRQSNTVTLTLLAPGPMITQQPFNQTVAAAPNTGVMFTLWATGTGTITYHWYAVNGETPISLGSGPDPNLYVSAEPYANLPQTFSYYCVVSDGNGNTRQSNTVTLTLLPPALAITQQPVSQVVAAAPGTGVTFTLAATGTGTITYHWYAVNGETPISLGSGPDPNLYVSAEPFENLPQTFSYYCVVSDGYGYTRQSNTVTLTLLPPGPMITQQPVSQTVAAAPGTGVTFTLAATGTGTITYHWYALSGETPVSLGSGADPHLYVSAEPYANLPQTFSYYCVVSDGNGNTRQSNTVTLTLLPPALSITQQPVSQTVVAAPGTGVTFTLAATGTGTITYHWYALNGETPVSLGSGPDPHLYVSAEPFENLPQTFSYYCVVSDGYGYTRQSNMVTLTLLPPG